MLSKILNYYKVVDESLELLSNKYEGNLTKLPTWALCNRRISVGIAKETFLIIKVEIEDNLDEDEINETKICSQNELVEFIGLFDTGFKYHSLPRNSFGWSISDMLVIETNNPNALPAFEFKGVYHFMTIDEVEKSFTTEKAKEESMNLWNNTKEKIEDNHNSFIYNLSNIFDRFEKIIKRKSFVERRIHRFINEYSSFLLPSHDKCYFEHPLYLNGNKRIADFILKQEDSMPALLIELETPSSKLFKKDGEATAEANHAKNQISEWIRYIEQNHENTSAEFDFLNGPKQRMVIIGRGLNFSKEMIESRYTDTIMWTYDFLKYQAISRWNKIILDQCKLLGIKEINQIPMGELINRSTSHDMTIPSRRVNGVRS